MKHTTETSPRAYLRRLCDAAALLDAGAIDAYADLLFEAWRADRMVFVFGNGGSSSCAAHHVADYVKTAQVNGHRRLRALCFTDNVPMLTAITNDLAFDQAFRHQLETYARPGDVAVAISASGNSPNITAACQWARLHGVTVVGITGFDGGRLATLAHLHLHVPSDNYGVIEDLQLSIGHLAAQCLQHRVAAAMRDAESHADDDAPEPLAAPTAPQPDAIITVHDPAPRHLPRP